LYDPAVAFTKDDKRFAGRVRLAKKEKLTLNKNIMKNVALGALLVFGFAANQMAVASGPGGSGGSGGGGGSTSGSGGGGVAKRVDGTTAMIVTPIVPVAPAGVTCTASFTYSNNVRTLGGSVTLSGLNVPDGTYVGVAGAEVDPINNAIWYFLPVGIGQVSGGTCTVTNPNIFSSTKNGGAIVPKSFSVTIDGIGYAFDCSAP
jgi:hypothetical protein